MTEPICKRCGAMEPANHRILIGCVKCESFAELQARLKKEVSKWKKNNKEGK